MGDRIEKRRTFAGTGMLAQPEYIDDLQARRAQHARLIAGTPKRSFQEWLDEKLYGPRVSAVAADPPPPGAIDPHMGLSPTQDQNLANSAKGRRSGRVIVKG